LPGQAGKLIGTITDGNFTKITDTCSADTQAAGDALSAGVSCKIDVGSDLVIWTKHASQYVAYTQTARPTNNNGGGGTVAVVSGGGGGGGGGGIVNPYGGRGDLNSDGKIDLLDFNLFMSQWGKVDVASDFNNDGKVDLQDFTILMANWK